MQEHIRKQYLKLMGIELYQPMQDIKHGMQQDIAIAEQSATPEPEIEAEEPLSEKVTEAVRESVPKPVSEPVSEPVSGSDDDLMSYMSMDQTLPDPETEDDEPEIAAQSPAADDLSALSWDELQQHIANCEKCSLCQSRTQTVFGVGNPQADVMVIGEAPGAEEDRQGEPFVGAAGKLLDNMLKAIGLDRQKVFIANILKCRPPANRNPSNEEAMACEGYLLRQIDLIQPKLILSVGGVSAKNLLKTEEAVGRLRQQQQKMVKRNLPVLVTYHPAYLLRKPSEKAKSWEDLKKFKQMMKDLIQA